MSELKVEDFDFCPYCYGSFSYNKPYNNGICPFCHKNIIKETLDIRSFALEMIKNSSIEDFKDICAWGQWLTRVAKAGLENDELELEMLNKFSKKHIL